MTADIVAVGVASRRVFHRDSLPNTVCRHWRPASTIVLHVTYVMLAEDVDFEDTAAELEDRRSSPPRYEIATYPADFTLEVLYGQWQSGDIFIPTFQRGFVWSQAQASKLIESFLLGLPVPSIFLCTERDSERSMVVDGQ